MDKKNVREVMKMQPTRMQMNKVQPMMKLLLISKAEGLSCFLDYERIALQLCTLTGELLYTKHFDGQMNRLISYLGRLRKDQLLYRLCDEWSDSIDPTMEYSFLS